MLEKTCSIYQLDNLLIDHNAMTNNILQDLFRDIPLDHIWALQIWSSGVSLKDLAKYS